MLRSPRRPMALLRGQRVLALGLAALVALLALSLLVPMLRPDPNLPDIEHGLSAQGAPLPPSLDAPLGTDDLGRDVLARVSVAARVSLATALAATVLAVALGLAIGLGAGLAAGSAAATGTAATSWLDAALMRLVDLVMSFPVVLLAIFAAAALRATAFESTTTSMALVLSLLGWPATARVIRTRVMALARSDFVTAAQALGASGRRLALRHVLPNLGGLVAVMATATAAQMLLAEALLSYAGLGARPPAPSWGRMVYEGRIYYRSAPWLMVVPGLAIVATVAAFQLVGQGLRRELERARP